MPTVSPCGVRLCIPSVSGRGAGLGNELYPWAKAWLAAQAINGTAIQPAFGLNPRQYWRYFGSSRVDFLTHRVMLQALPRYTFTEADYLSTGEDSFSRAVEVFADRHGWRERRFFALEVGGMWGGFLAIREARDFVLAKLYGARDTVLNLTDWRRRLNPDRLVVAVHIRAGDFKAADDAVDYRGCFNRALPLSWYMAICGKLKQHFGDRVQFQLITDSNPIALTAFINQFSPITGFHQRNSVCSDVLAMASADLLICSVSSFSLWGAFLSRAPYVWFAPQMQSESGFSSIWGHEASQRPPAGATARFANQIAGASVGACSRGTPFQADGALPTELVQRLERALSEKQTATDLCLYGVVPAHHATIGTPL